MSALFYKKYCLILEEIHHLLSSLHRKPEELTLVAVTKKQPLSAIQELYQAGCLHFGESRIQEAESKVVNLPACYWHLIGTLQKNKVAKAVALFSLIHSVDSLELAQKISYISALQGKTTSILLQVNTARDPAKKGLSEEAWESHLEKLLELPHLKIEGLMTMAALNGTEKESHQTFERLRLLKEKWDTWMPASFRHLSMGMSSDYRIALAEGATLIRLGSVIFN